MSNNGTKRKKDGVFDELTGREKKKQRMAEARAIPVQVPSTSSAQAGPSKVIPTKNSLAGLPSAIDVEKFAEARAFEIKAMQVGMKTASAGSTQRAWQALPRHLRRRAASHDVRRVPVRLRERAKAEMDAKPKKPNPLPKRGRLKVVTRTESFLKRQKDKIWLETHLWHSKRMKMENMWGYRLATQPTEKAFRPSHRASIQGSIIHDASYFSLVELRGPENALITTLELCCDPQGPSPGSIAYQRGARSLETHLYRPSAYPHDLISPVSIMWQPNAEAPGQTNTLAFKPTQGLVGASSSTQIQPRTLTNQIRNIWIRFHPSVHEEVMEALKAATSQHLSTYVGGPEVQIRLTELRDQINVFEIMGPKANQVIKGALSPGSGDERKDFSQWWSTLGDVQSSGCLPRNMVIGFKVLDPRLKFPPQNAKPRESDSSDQRPASHIFPSASLAKSEIWDEIIRLGIARPRYQKKDLDFRRSQNPIPGTKLQPLRQDDRVPVLMIQRSLEAQGDHSTRSESIHGWTIIVPSGWGMAFWSSLTYTGTRIAGQRERQVQAYEAGTHYFPRDFPSTAAYDTFSAQREIDLRADWERKPPAKRVNYDKLGVTHPWQPEWRQILGLPALPSWDLVSTQRNPAELSNSKAKPWLLRGSNAVTLLDSVASSFIHKETLLGEINRCRSRRSLQPLAGASQAADLLQGALVAVRLTMTSRGTPEDMGIIYSMEDREVQEELKTLCKPKAFKSPAEDDENVPEQDLPSSDRTIGRVTTGHYSLSRGGGFGVAVIPFTRMIELRQQIARLKSNGKADRPPFVKVRNVGSRICRPANIELLMDGYQG